MSKIITVWGNPGCGKSMFCCNLAKVLTAGKEKALIINADSSTPMLPVWMPERILESSASIWTELLLPLHIRHPDLQDRNHLPDCPYNVPVYCPFPPWYPIPH